MSENKNKAGFPSDDDLASAANEVLLASDPYTISAKQIRLQLEEKFGCELTTKKDLLRTIIENFLVDRRSESEKEDEKQEAASSGKAKKPVGKGFGSVLYTSQLANFMQKDSGTRTEVSQAIWRYIREHNLQNPQDKREIVCDEKLTALFKRRTINMLKMTKALAQMMKTTQGMVEPSQPSRNKRSADEHDIDGKDYDGESTKQVKKKARKESEEAKGGKGNKKENGFQKAVHYSSRLATFMHTPSGPRTAVTKAVWDHIKQHQLQNPRDKREILCDEALETLLGKRKVNMFSMTKLLATMMHSTEPGDSEDGSEEEMDEEEESKPSKTASRAKSEADKKKKKSTRSSGEKKERNKTRSGFAAEVRFTPKLANFMDAPSAPRTDVSKKIWAYIKEHGLQDPQDKRQILCDNSLKALLGVNKVHMFTMNKILQPMILPLKDAKGEEGEEVVSADGRGKPFDIYKVKKYDWKRVVKLSHRLREFIGTKYALKSAVQRRFRDYIDKHKLYTKKHNIKRVICDEALRKVFKRKKFDRFMLNEFLDKHMTKMKVRATKRRKRTLDGDHQLSPEHPHFLRIEEYTPSEMRLKTARDGLQTDLAEVLLLSHALQQVVGLTTATVQQATLGLLQYARERQLLRGPSTGKQYVRCDKVLTELFGGADKVKFKKIRLMILRESSPVGDYLIDQSIERDGIDAPKYEEDSVLQIKTPLGEFIKLPKDESPEESCNAVKEASKQDEQRKKKQKKSTSGSSNLTVIHKRLYSATQEGKSRVHSLKEKLRKQPIASRSLREVSEKVKKKRVLKSLVSVSSK